MRFAEFSVDKLQSIKWSQASSNNRAYRNIQVACLRMGIRAEGASAGEPLGGRLAPRKTPSDLKNIQNNMLRATESNDYQRNVKICE